MISYCNNIKYPNNWGFKREPARPVKLRIDYCGGMKFNDNFDWDNLWHDAVQIDDTTVILVGPPLYDTKDWLKKNATFSKSEHLDIKNMLHVRFAELDRACYTILTTDTPILDSRIYLRTTVGTIEIELNRSDGNTFKNKIVMVTLQKDNPIEWIQQWVHYHHNVLGVDGFLIYDNNSTKYDIIKLEYCLKLTGATIQVVSWPYPYGPQGSDFAPWDSDYCQLSMLEHSKLRYLGNAALVLNNDIDEYLVTKGVTLTDVADYLKNNKVNSLKCKGVWIAPYDYANKCSANSVTLIDRQAKDYYCVDPDYKVGLGYKWMLVPTDDTINQQWVVHQVSGKMVESAQIYYAHLLAMNTNWSWERDKFSGDVNNLIIDEHLKSKLDQAFNNTSVSRQ